MKKVTLLFLLFLSISAVHTQGQNITFSHLTTDDGLSQFSVNSMYIDERGIEMTALFRKTLIPWQAVQNFSTRRVVFFKQVFFNLDESLINDKTKRKQGVFPDNYGMKAQELAELLNSYKNQILK